MDTPRQTPAAVVVTPIPAAQSRTLRLTTVLTWLSYVVAVLPSALAFILQLLGDPEIAAMVSDMIPARYRVPFGVIMFIVAQRYGQLRKGTVAPIAGTDAAAQAQQLISPAHVAPEQK
jgi:hypothetical protein